MSTVQSIIRHHTTVAATFTGKPSDETRERMKNAGAVFKNGQWVKTIPFGKLGTEEEAVRAFEALADIGRDDLISEEIVATKTAA